MINAQVTKGILSMKISNKGIVYIAVAVCGIIIISLVMTYLFSVRRELKSQCVPASGMDCGCFANVIDNRLSDREVKIFARFTRELRIRPNANILEFTDEVTARNISMAVSLCRPIQQIPQENNNQKVKR